MNHWYIQDKNVICMWVYVLLFLEGGETRGSERFSTLQIISFTFAATCNEINTMAQD